MNIKQGQIREALDELRSKASLHEQPNHEISISLREEDPGKGVIGGCLVINTTVVKKAGQYDAYKGNITTEYTLEVFSADENRPIRWTSIETRDLVK